MKLPTIIELVYRPYMNLPFCSMEWAQKMTREELNAWTNMIRKQADDKGLIEHVDIHNYILGEENNLDFLYHEQIQLIEKNKSKDIFNKARI